MKQIAAVEVERCYALADLLDKVPDETFDLRSWVLWMPKDRQTRLFGLIETSPACGFAGCAMGWAAHARIFPGFYLHNGNILYNPEGRTPSACWRAVSAVMGINLHIALYLFAAIKYKTHATPTMVADRLRRFARKIEAIRARGHHGQAPAVRNLELISELELAA